MGLHITMQNRLYHVPLTILKAPWHFDPLGSTLLVYSIKLVLYILSIVVALFVILINNDLVQDCLFDEFHCDQNEEIHLKEFP